MQQDKLTKDWWKRELDSSSKLNFPPSSCKCLFWTSYGLVAQHVRYFQQEQLHILLWVLIFPTGFVQYVFVIFLQCAFRRTRTQLNYKGKHLKSWQQSTLTSTHSHTLKCNSKFALCLCLCMCMCICKGVNRLFVCALPYWAMRLVGN